MRSPNCAPSYLDYFRELIAEIATSHIFKCEDDVAEVQILFNRDPMKFLQFDLDIVEFQKDVNSKKKIMICTDAKFLSCRLQLDDNL